MSREKRAIAELVSAAPSFRLEWRGFLRKRPDATEAVGELVEHLGTGEVRHAELAATLQVAAQLLQRRDEQEAIRVASDLLEDLQLLASYPDTGLQAGDVEAFSRRRVERNGMLWTRVSGRLQRRIAERAAEFIEKDERIQAAFFAQDTPVRGQPLLSMSLLKQVGHLVIGATERNIYVVSRGLFASGAIRGVVRRYSIDSTPVELHRGWGRLTIGTDDYWIAGLASRGDATDFVNFVLGVVGRSPRGDGRPETDFV